MQHPCTDDRGNGNGGLSDGSKISQQGPDCRWIAYEPNGDPRRDTHGAFAPDERPPQVEAGRVGAGTAEHGQLAVGQYHFNSEDMGARDAMQEAVWSTGVRSDVAPDGTGLLTRRIRRVIQTERDRGLRQIEIQDPGLHPGQAIVGVDLQDPVHLRGGKHYRTAEGHGTSGQAGA